MFSAVLSYGQASHAIIRQLNAATWTGMNPVLYTGEFGWDITNQCLKIGNGSDHWNDIPCFRTDSSGGGGTGPAGPPGADGNTILSGIGDPSPSTGVDGDYYISSTWYIFGPKSGGTWPSGILLLGTDGSDGVDGTDGATWYNGSGAPSSGLGVDGDYYLDTSNGDVYFKASGSYSVVTNLTGPPGSFTPAALTKTDDTNVTLTLGGTPATALLQATSITAGWAGQLAISRGGTGLSSIGSAGQLIRVDAAGTALEYFTNKTRSLYLETHTEVSGTAILAEELLYAFTIPGGTVVNGDAIDIQVLAVFSSAAGSDKTFRIRVDTASTGVTGTIVAEYQSNNSSGNTLPIKIYQDIKCKANGGNTMEAAYSRSGAFSQGLLTFLTTPNINLSNTWYIKITSDKAATIDVMTLKYANVYVNKL